MDSIVKPTVTVCRNVDRPGFLVEVLPPQPISHDREFACYRAAYGYASGLRMTHGWRLVDLSDEWK